MDRETIRHLAELSYIDLTEDERDEFINQLKEIFIHIEDVMGNAEYASIDATSLQEHYLENIDEDKVNESFRREAMLLNAKREKNGFVLVPKIIKGDN